MRMDRSDALGPIVSGFSGGGYRIDDNVYRALLITPERADGWEPPALAALTADELAPILDLAPAPEFLLLGTGPARARPARGDRRTGVAARPRAGPRGRWGDRPLLWRHRRVRGDVAGRQRRGTGAGREARRVKALIIALPAAILPDKDGET